MRRFSALMVLLVLATVGVVSIQWVARAAPKLPRQIARVQDRAPDLRSEEVAPPTSQTGSLDVLRFPVIITPPVASLIDLGEPDASGWVTITGASRSVVPNTVVVAVCLDTSQFTYVMADEDGRFEARLLVPRGGFVQIKHAFPPVPFGELPASYTGTGPGDIMIEWMNATAGTIVQVPLAQAVPGGPRPFGMAGTIAGEEGEGYWTFTGTYGPEVHEGAETRVPLQGTMRITTPAIPAGFDPTSIEVVAKIWLQRLFAEGGRQIPMSQVLVSMFRTPTGFPISRESNKTSPIEQALGVTGWQQSPDLSLVAPIAITLVVPSDIQPGHYSHRMSFWFSGVPLGPETPTVLRPGFVYGGGYLPMIRVGEPAPPRLWWTLLTDTLSGGTRGAVAREDKDVIGLIPLTTFQDDGLVVPRLDPRSGQPIAYRLEPYLPLVALTDRGTPNPPVVPFRFPSGQLTVIIRKPDGQTASLGPEPFLQCTSRTPAFADGQVMDNDGGAIQDVYQLTTLRDEFVYPFEQYGHHVITMVGSIDDIWGNQYSQTSTFDLYVARPLEVELGELPTTPYEVGDYFSPAAHIYPPVPANVSIQLLHLPNSDPGQAQVFVIRGQANRFGFLLPPLEQAVRMTTPGEFRVDVTAVYTEEDGTLWMGTDTWGSIVETPNSSLVAHGRRGVDVETEPLLWFFHDILLPGGAAHTFYPYYSGDIFWGFVSFPGVEPYGADAILPAVTIEDTRGDVYSIIRDRWGSAHKQLVPWEALEERLVANEAPLFSTTSDGTDVLWSPDKVDQLGYAYRSSQRPGARVHETVSEEGLGIAYWRYDDPYGNQVGYAGDLPNDLKWEFGGAVFRNLSADNAISDYAIYGSLWVLSPPDDPLQGRVMPPFQGAVGGPSGGPILTLKGQEIDMLFLPMGIQPGDVLEVGDVIAFSGHVGPPLSSRVSVTITAPSGDEYGGVWSANKVGWVYDPEFHLIADEPGVWTVEAHVKHDEPYAPTGLVPSSHNTGGVLGAANGRYSFYVVPRESERLPIVSPRPGYLSWPTDVQTGLPLTVTQVLVTASIPPGLRGVHVDYTVRMPGFILDQGTTLPDENSVTVAYDPIALHRDFPNVDLIAKEGSWPGLADPVLITLLVSGNRDGERAYHAGAVLLDGDEVQMPGAEWSSRHPIFLPVIVRMH